MAGGGDGITTGADGKARDFVAPEPCGAHRESARSRRCGAHPRDRRAAGSPARSRSGHAPTGRRRRSKSW